MSGLPPPSKVAFSLRERLFCLFAYLPKATVQAALGSVPLAAGDAGGQVMLSVAVLSILITAPIGLLLIRGLGPKLLDSYCTACNGPHSQYVAAIF